MQSHKSFTIECSEFSFEVEVVEADQWNSLRDFQGGFNQKMEFSTFKPLLGSKNVKSMTPQS